MSLFYQLHYSGLMSDNEEYQFMTLGHSLGGALAHITGSSLNIRAMGFEMPGIMYVKSKSKE